MCFLLLPQTTLIRHTETLQINILLHVRQCAGVLCNFWSTHRSPIHLSHEIDVRSILLHHRWREMNLLLIFRRLSMWQQYYLGYITLEPEVNHGSEPSQCDIWNCKHIMSLESDWPCCHHTSFIFNQLLMMCHTSITTQVFPGLGLARCLWSISVLFVFNARTAYWHANLKWHPHVCSEESENRINACVCISYHTGAGLDEQP